MFRVSRLKEHPLAKNIEDRVLNSVLELGPSLDAIVISDFVYGVITPNLLELLADLATKQGLLLFGDLQCSSQVGTVTRFKDFTLLCPNEREARFAVADQDSTVGKLSELIQNASKCKNLIFNHCSSQLYNSCTSGHTC